MIGKWPDPISFLEDYKNFAINIRPIAIRALVELSSKTNCAEQKQILFCAAYEQFFFAIETLLAFFNAAVDETPLDLAKWIYPKPLNGTKYYEFSYMQKNVQEMEYDHIYEVYRNEFADLSELDINLIIEPLKEILTYLRETRENQQSLSKNITNDMITIFNRSKHKFLAYRFKGGVCFLLPKEIEARMHQVALKTKKEKDKDLVQDISWLINHIQTPVDYTRIVIDIIIKRLKKRGANKWISGPAKNMETISLPY